VNFVWNFCNETPTKAVKAGRKWLDVDDLDRLTKGATKAGRDPHAPTVQKICEQYDTSRHLSHLPISKKT
jgi:putative transposase